MLTHPMILWFINTDLGAVNRYRTKMSPWNRNIAVTKSQHHIINSTNPRRALDDSVEHRLHVRRRAADDAEHFGRRRLMFQSLAQFRVAFLNLFKQPDVFDGNYSLRREGFE